MEFPARSVPAPPRLGGGSLEAVFRPSRIAVIGASETPGSVGRTIIENLWEGGFSGQVFPVNLKRSQILGRTAYPSIQAVPAPVDLAVIATPAPSVPGVVEECARQGVQGALIISAGFKERGPAGAELEREVLEKAKGRLRIIGPNCLGIMMPHQGINASFAAGMAPPGNVAFVSQSGALCTAILDWSLQENVGFSAFISAGSMLDVGWGDLIDYLGDDPATQSILLYMESVGDARAFMSAAREAALAKPIIVLKAGSSEAAAQAAVSHTGAMAGSDPVLEAAFQRCGVLRVKEISELFDMAEVLAKQPRPRGPSLTILTNAGGPGVLATDTLMEEGGRLTQLSSRTLESLNGILPAHWSHGNPIDLLGDAEARQYSDSLEIVGKEESGDGLLVILAPQGMTHPSEVARQVCSFAHKHRDKPILASWMGGRTVQEGEELLNQAQVPTFEYPDGAARAFVSMWRYSESLRALYETPSLAVEEAGREPDRARAEQIIGEAKRQGRTLLSELESKQLLSAYGIPTVQTYPAECEGEAVAIASRIGYPVVLKVHSDRVTHKSELDAVHLDLQSEADVLHAFTRIRTSVARHLGERSFQGVTVQPMVAETGYELIVGSHTDPQFGPVLLFGWGGRLVEVLEDRALAIPPLNLNLARRMMQQTRVYRALQGVRGRAPVNLHRLEKLLVGFSRLVLEQPAIREMDINPLLASPGRLLALDARVILHDPALAPGDLPRPAIRPYPIHYIQPFQMENGPEIIIRPIRPEDEPALKRFRRSLGEVQNWTADSQQPGLHQPSLYERLSRICFIDYDREMVLVALEKGASSEIIGIGSLKKVHRTSHGELRFLIDGRSSEGGLKRELLRRLLQFARDEGLKTVAAETGPQDRETAEIVRSFGLSLHPVRAGASK